MGLSVAMAVVGTEAAVVVRSLMQLLLERSDAERQLPHRLPQVLYITLAEGRDPEVWACNATPGINATKRTKVTSRFKQRIGLASQTQLSKPRSK